MFWRGKRKLIGLDIGSSTVKIVQLHKNSGGWTVSAAGIAHILGPGENQSDAATPQRTRAIDECLRVCGRTTDLAACAVGGPEVAVRFFEFASTTPIHADLSSAVRRAAKQECPFASNGIAIDYHLTSNGNGRTSGYWVAAADRLVKNTVKTAEKAGLNCVLMDTEGLALINCLRQLYGSTRGVAILNVGNSHTTLAIEGSDDRPFIRHLSCGGDTVIDTIARRTQVPADTLRASLLDCDEDGPCGVPCSSKTYRAAAEKGCGEFVAAVRKTLGHCRTLDPALDAQEIWVCGDFALADGFVQLLDKQLPMKVSVWNPFKQMSIDVGRGRKGAVRRTTIRRNGPAMAVAAGLAMRSI